MNEITYILYIITSSLIVIYVGNFCYRNGKVYILNYFPNEFSIDLALYVHALKNHYKVIRFPVNFNKNKRKYGEGSSDNIIKCIKNSFVQFYHALIILIK